MGGRAVKEKDEKKEEILAAYTPKEFGKMFNLHYQTVLRWCWSKPQRIHGVKMGKVWRIPYEEKDEFLKRQKQITKEARGG